MGCPGAKLTQDSNCLSHDPSLKDGESNFSAIVTGDSLCKKLDLDTCTHQSAISLLWNLY